MEAVEYSVPLYESISEAISLGLAGPLRRRAIEWLRYFRKDWVLDLGTGPGVSSRILLSTGFEKVVGVDPSPKLLKFATSMLGEGFHPVVGIAENLPFRAGSFDGVLTCFALRDVKDLVESLREVSRVVRNDGGLAVVDIGKPDGLFWRELLWLYVSLGMPLVARLLIRGRIRGNPFRMIIPTFQRLLTNGRLLALMEREFGPSKLKEFMLGGLVIVEAKKAGSGLEMRIRPGRSLLHEVPVAMRPGDGPLSNINRVIHIHPALSEVVQRASASVH